jgi:hypothetical protein
MDIKLNPDVLKRYPEHTKLMGIMARSQPIGEFLDEMPYTLAEYQDVGGESVLMPVHKDINQILADFFDIDLKKIETEKRGMIEELRRHGREV